MGFDLTKIPSGEERITQALSEIEGELKRVSDPDVWSRDDESLGLLMLLERGAACGAYGIALSIAFDLGKAAVVGKADPAALGKFRAAAEARRRGTQNSATVRGARAKAWRAMLQPIVLEERRLPSVDRIKQEALKRLAWERMKKILGDDCPAEATIYDAVEEIERKPNRHTKASR